MKRIKSVVIASLLAPALALAQPKTADDWYKEGETQYNLGNFEKAAEAFKNGFANEKDDSKKPAYLYNVAQALRLVGNRCKDAAFFYKRYLSLKEQDTVKPLKPEKRAEIEQRIAEQEECAKTQAGGTPPPKPGAGTPPKPGAGTPPAGGTPPKPGAGTPPAGGTPPKPGTGTAGTPPKPGTGTPPAGGTPPKPGTGTTGTAGTTPKPGTGTTPAGGTPPKPGTGTTGTTGTTVTGTTPTGTTPTGTTPTGTTPTGTTPTGTPTDTTGTTGTTPTDTTGTTTTTGTTPGTGTRTPGTRTGGGGTTVGQIGVETGTGGEPVDDGGEVRASLVPALKDVSARFELGAARVFAGDLNTGTRATFALSGGYPVFRQDKLLVEAGGMMQYTPINYENFLTMAQGRATLFDVLAAGMATYEIMPKITARGDLGLGLLAFGGIREMGNPFTQHGAPTTGPLWMFNFRIAASGEYEVIPNLYATVTPFALSISPAKDGLREDIGAIVRLDFMVGVGYRMP